MILAIFDLQVIQCFQSSFKSIGFSVQENKRKNGFSLGTILAILFLIYKLARCFLPSFESTEPGGRRSRLLKQIVDAARHDARGTTDIDWSQ